MAFRITTFNLLRPGLRCLSRSACSFSSNMVVRVTTRNSFSLGHTSAPSASDMAVQVTPRNSFSLGHTSAPSASDMAVRVTTCNSISLGHTSAPSASDMAVQVTPRNHASNHAPKLLFRARLFFGRNRLRVYRIYSGAVCERSQILANGRHILSQVPSNPMFAIRCLQYDACKKLFAQRAKITPFCR